MLRCFFIALLWLGLVNTTPAKDISIRWHGQSFFEIISAEGTRVAIDPHFLEVYGRRRVKADVVLMSHWHIDHIGEEPIENIKDGKIKVIRGLKNPKGLNGDRKLDEWATIDETVKGVHVQSVASYHDN